MLRFRVKNAAKAWTDKGPDLLRTRDSGEDTLRGIVEPGTERLSTKVNDFDPKLAENRLTVFDRFTRWALADGTKDGDLFRVFSNGDLIAIAKAVRITVVDFSPDAHAGTELNYALIREQFGDACKFGGGFVCKQTSPGYYSDHAWQDAVDASLYALNDEATDWVARMRATGNMVFDYALGSRDGRVVQVTRTGEVEPSGASDSHLWHIHISTVDHDGARPPCA